MGIGIETKDDKTVISYRDRMGQIQKVVAKTTDEARKQLLGVLNLKFGQGVSGSTGKNLRDMVTVLKNSLGDVLDNIGAGLLPAVKRVVAWITDNLNKWIESGKLVELGKKMGEYLSSAVTHIMAFFDTLPKFFESIQKLWSQGGEKLGTVLNAVFTAGGNLLATSFVAALQASYDIWYGIAQIMGAAIEEAIMSLPNMPGSRAGRAESAINAMPMDQLMGIAQQAKIFGDQTQLTLAMLQRWGEPQARKGISAQVSTLGDKVQKQFILGQAGNEFKAGAGRAMNAIPEMLKTIGATAKEEMGKIGAAITGGTGIDLGSVYSQNLAARQGQAAEAPSGMARYLTNRREFVPTPTGGYSRWSTGGEFTAETGRFKTGDRVRGEYVVNIQNLTIKANDAREMQVNLVKSAYGASAAAGLSGRPYLVAASY
jgi:hypothetical protein